MEEVSYLFNADYESFLASSKEEYLAGFSLENSEFEYFIALIDNLPIYTKKNYSKTYLSYLKAAFGIDLKLSTKLPTKCWLGEMYDIPIQRQIASKVFQREILQKYNREKSSLISKSYELEEGYIYKKNFSSSGRGTFLFPRDEKQILKILKTEQLIKEKKISRDIDIASLFTDEGFVHYENEVDDQFQYKGSVIGGSFSDCSWFSKYVQDLEEIRERFVVAGIQGTWNVDAFCYQDRIHFCEINNRKTMGHIAWKLKRRFFEDKSFMKLKLINSKKLKQDPYLLIEHFPGICLSVSPNENRFTCILVSGDTREDLKQNEQKVCDYLLSK